MKYDFKVKLVFEHYGIEAKSLKEAKKILKGIYFDEYSLDLKEEEIVWSVEKK